MLTLKDIIDFMDPHEHSEFLEIFKVRFKECCQKVCEKDDCTVDCQCICNGSDTDLPNGLVFLQN